MNLDSAVITETERIDEWATQDRGEREESERERRERAVEIFTATGEKRNLDREMRIY